MPDSPPASADAGAPGADAEVGQNYPAFDFPRLTASRAGDSEVGAPRIVPVLFHNDPNPNLAATIGDFLGRWTSSPYWKQQVSEYGVGDVTVAPTVTPAQDAPALTSDQEIATWLTGQLDGTHTDVWGTPDKNSVYVLIYPPTTTISDGQTSSCKDYSGYHHSLPLSATLTVYRAVIPQCSPGTHTGVISHEIVEAVTDGAIGKGYDGLAPPYSLFGGGELADLCDSSGTVMPADVGYPFQRTWSNAASLAGGDRCVPVPAGEPYFGAFPVLPDRFSDKSGATDEVVIVPPGQSKTIDVRLFSTGPLPGLFTVSVSKATNLALTLDRTQGQNGDILHLTIQNNGTATQGTASFSLTSTLGKTQHFFPGSVSFQ
jgi:hypothetical protein